MSLSTRIAPHLPYLRRFSRAVTGSQTSGDAYVAASLQAIIADPLASRDAQSRVQLFIQQLLAEGAAPVVTSSEVPADASSEAPVSSSAEVSSSAQ